MKGSDLRKVQFSTKGPTDNMLSLTKRLSEIFDHLAAASIVPDQAKEMANVAGKIIKGIAIQSEYNAMRKDPTPIPYLSMETDKNP